MMDAADIVDHISEGVQKALKTNQLFLGVEKFEFKNADIHPEYITTVKVAEQFIDPGLEIRLEAMMRKLRQQAVGMAGRHNKKKVGQLKRYKFGKDDRQRLDILVRRDDSLAPPLLVAEAKLGTKNHAGIKEDVKRVFRLLRMYQKAGALVEYNMYGAVIFHSMQVGEDPEDQKLRSWTLPQKIQDYLNKKSLAHPWLESKAGLICASKQKGDVSSYKEFYVDGSCEEIFAKDAFTLVPGLILLGNDPAISGVTF